MFCHMHRPSHTPGFDHPQFCDDRDETPEREIFSALYYGCSRIFRIVFTYVSNST